MKWVIRFLIGIIISVILLTICDTWLFSNSDYDWLEPLNEVPDPDDIYSNHGLDWNGNVR